MVIDLVIQPLDERLHLLREPQNALATHDLCIENGLDALNRMLQIVIDHDVLVFVDGTQFLQR
jgi:hypothetical protein